MSLVAYGTGSSDDESDEENSESSTTESQAKKQVETSALKTIETHPLSLETQLEASDSDEDNDPIKPFAAASSIFMKLPKPKNINDSQVLNPGIGIHSLFASLPLPKANSELTKIVAPVKKTVKILVPPLLPVPSKDKDDEEPPKKKNKPSVKGSGLFSLLPAPRNVTLKETKRSFVPHVLTKKPTAQPVKAAPQPPKVQKLNTESIKLISYADSGDDSEEETGTPHDFFSLQSDGAPVDVLPSIPSYEDILPSSSNISEPEDDEEEEEIEIPNDQPLAFVSGFQPSPWSGTSAQVQPGPSWQTPNEEPLESQVASMDEDYLSVVENDLQLDDEALERLCGRRAKKQKQPVEVINVSGAEIMPDPKEWLIKQLSQEQPKRRSHSHKKNDGPTSQQRRKHQITYLAFQAKENELELKNQWSQNRVSRKQTQSKYGF